MLIFNNLYILRRSYQCLPYEFSISIPSYSYPVLSVSCYVLAFRSQFQHYFSFQRGT